MKNLNAVARGGHSEGTGETIYQNWDADVLEVPFLETANIKLSSVATNVVGVSARAMLEGLLGGQEDTRVLAEMARGSLRKKLPELEQALEGRIEAIHRFVLAQQLAHIDYLDEAVERCSEEIERRMGPYSEAAEQLDTIPGVNRRVAEVLVAEIGVDMSVFPSPPHLASWAGMCPGNNESAGKRKSGKTRKGSFEERRLLVETLFKRVDAQGDKVAAYELNPPFTMFCPGPDRNENGPDGDPSGPVRVLSTVVELRGRY